MRRVAVLIESSRAYGRGLLRGVGRYNREHGHWSIYLQPHGLDHPPPPWLKRWRGDGVLVRISDRRMLSAVLSTGLPTVDLRGLVTGLGVPFIGVDNRAVAELAAEHLLDRGLRQFGPERIGYEAAVLLDQMMQGEAVPLDPVLLPPRGVVLRQSTDTLAVEDPEVVAVLRYIRRHAYEGLLVDDLLAQIPFSRSVLERRFRALVGRSPKAEISRVQLERAKLLLSESHLPLDVVAARSGFRDARYLCDVFAKRVGMTPKTYREQTRR